MKVHTPEQALERQQHIDKRILGGLAVAFGGTALLYVGAFSSPSMQQPASRPGRPGPVAEQRHDIPGDQPWENALMAAGGALITGGAVTMIISGLQSWRLEGQPEPAFSDVHHEG